MSNYKISKLVEDRTLNYRFSVNSKKDEEYKALKHSVKIHNDAQVIRAKNGMDFHFLRVRGRGRNPTKSGSFNKYSIIDDLATYFDVYVQRDTDREYRWKNKNIKSKASLLLTNAIKGAITKGKSRVAA